MLDYYESNESPHNTKKQQKAPPCMIVDNFLKQLELVRLQSVFESSTSHNWASHDYAVEAPPPCFSYVLVLSLQQRETTERFLTFMI